MGPPKASPVGARLPTPALPGAQGAFQPRRLLRGLLRRQSPQVGVQGQEPGGAPPGNLQVEGVVPGRHAPAGIPLGKRHLGVGIAPVVVVPQGGSEFHGLPEGAGVHLGEHLLPERVVHRGHAVLVDVVPHGDHQAGRGGAVGLGDGPGQGPLSRAALAPVAQDQDVQGRARRGLRELDLRQGILLGPLVRRGPHAPGQGQRRRGQNESGQEGRGPGRSGGSGPAGAPERATRWTYHSMVPCWEVSTSFPSPSPRRTFRTCS
jgi:hypothetical protein